MPGKAAITHSLLELHGKSFAAELGVSAEKNTPSPLFRLLCFALLAGSRINAATAMHAARELARAGWTTAEKMKNSSWRERTRTLNHAGYARYDESTSRMLGATAALLVEEYGGDLRALRSRAGRDPAVERKLLKQCKGLGDVGVNIFMREAQAGWEELHPFADKLALQAAARLELGDDAFALTRLVERREFPRFVAALVRCALAKDHAEVIAAAC